MNRYSVEKTQLKKRKPNYTGIVHVGQMPKAVCYFTDRKKLYLHPGVDMRISDHPTYITNPVYPTGATQTRIKWLLGKCLNHYQAASNQNG